MKGDVIRSRMIREAILTTLSVMDAAGSSFGLKFDQLHEGFARSRLEVGASELRADLNDLRDDGLIVEQWDQDVSANIYRISSRGRDFKRAGMPWQKIDEYTGSETPARD